MDDVRRIALALLVVGVVGLIGVFVWAAIMQTTDLPDVNIVRAVTGAWQSWCRWLFGTEPIEDEKPRTTDDVMRQVIHQRMSSGYKRSKQEKIRQALTHQMPPLTWAEQCWLYECAFGHSITVRKRCQECHDEGCPECTTTSEGNQCHE